MKKLLLSLLLIITSAGLAVQAAPKEKPKRFEIKDGKFLIDGKSEQFICGEMHYNRIPQEYWRDRLKRAKAMGLNTVSAYVFWSFHERQPGVFDFKGQADISKFIKMAQEEGLYVLLRPGPYVCAEYDFGGYPWWLLNEKEMVVRSNDEKFLSYCRRYINALGKQLSKQTIENGGNIIMVQVENEYGSYSNDKVYLGKLRDMIKEAGFNVPLITCDGGGQMPNGYVDGALPTINGVVGEEIKTIVDKYHPGGPYFVAEFYPAWFDVWGKPHSLRAYQKPAEQLEWMLKNDVSVSIYMFHGGTNFWYTNGANTSYGYEPQPTSYDYDAPLGEYGNIYPKYKAFRSIIEKNLPQGEKLPPIPAENKVIAIPEIQLTECAPLSAAFNQFGKPIHSEDPMTMEALGQDFGYVRYATEIASPVSGKLTIGPVRDYAVVLLNGKQIGAMDRRHPKNSSIQIDVPTVPATLEIVVENVGRVNYGSGILDNHKGILESVKIDGQPIKGWSNRSLPLYKMNPKKLKFTATMLNNQPAFFKGTFTLNDVGDSFIDTRGWGKGAVWVNGHSLGKYWEIGPQQTLYLPAPWLKKGKNEIVVFALEDAQTNRIKGLTQPILNELGKDKLKVVHTRDLSKKPILEEGDRVMTSKAILIDAPQTFSFDRPVTMRHICLEILSSYDDKNASISELDLIDSKGNVLPKDQWKVMYVNSEEVVGGEGLAENLFDKDVNTYWHSVWQNDDANKAYQKKLPYQIVIDLGEICDVKSLRLVQRNKNMPGRIKDFRVYGRPQFFLFE